MFYPSLFDSFFAPTRVIVVSEERLQAAEREAQQQQLDSLNNRINELTDYRDQLELKLKPSRVGKDLDQLDGDVNNNV